MIGYREYLYDLAEQLGCELRLAPNMAGMMYVEFGYVEGPDPYTSWLRPQQSFAVGLHELGHFALGHTQGRPPKEHERFYFDNGVLRSEAQAWHYALDHFDYREEVVEKETKTYMWERCLNSYYRGALLAGDSLSQLWNGNRHHVKFIYDKPDHIFHQARQRILTAA